MSICCCMNHTAFNSSDTSQFNNHVEPVFYSSLNKNKKLPVYLDSVHVFNFFEYALKKKPNDLSCHIQRIEFSISEKNTNELYSALCDLFIVLGPLGLPLRKRLFSCCKKYLTQYHIKLLSSYLGDQFLTNNMALLPDSCFFKKLPFDVVEFGVHLIPESKGDEDVLYIAESYIENSQFETALEYMLNKLERDPENVELTKKLLSTFKALDYKKEFQNAYDRFSKNSATSEYWHEMNQYFLKQKT